MRSRALTGPGVALAMAAGACNCGDDDLGNISKNTVTVESPTAGETVFTTNDVVFRAVATNPGGLQYLSLQLGTAEFKVCDAGEDNTAITCEGTFDAKSYASQIDAVTNELTLTAVSKDSFDVLTRAELRIFVKPLVIKIKRPVIPTGRDRATLRGRDPVEVTVESATPVEVVEIRLDDELVRASRQDQPSYSWNDVVWAALAAGTGDHELKAQARDVNGQVDTALLQVRILCANDTECAAGTRCCTDDGLCHATVARGAECDCANPCPADQGCFPGICGQIPRKCRPGCNPGNDTRYADRCSPQEGSTAYCLRLPANEVTAENKGGACSLADGCDVVLQDCPDLPVDRTKLPAEDNPRVAHTCVPVSPVATACLPAGTIPLDGENCQYDTCGDPSSACGKGLLCVTTVDAQGAPQGPSHCSKQCARPQFSGFPSQAPDCPQGEYCSGLMGVGRERIGTGVCSDMGF